MSVDFMKFDHDIFQFMNSVIEHLLDYEKYENTNSALYRLYDLRIFMIGVFLISCMTSHLRVYIKKLSPLYFSFILSSSILIELLKKKEKINTLDYIFVVILSSYFSTLLIGVIFSLFDWMTFRNNKSKSDNETSKVLNTDIAQESTVNQHAAH